MRSLRMAAVQFQSAYGDKLTNLKKIQQLCEKAKQEEVDLVLFPELCISGFILDSTLADVAEPIPGPTTIHLEQVAKRLNMTICAGLIEHDKGLYYNAQLLIGPGGLIGKYRKVHLPTVEYPWYSSGGRFPVFAAGGYSVGIMTCCDNLFPEQTRILAIEGAELILSPFCWLYEHEDSRPVQVEGEPEPLELKNWVKRQLKTILAGRAYENGVYIAVANQSGQIGVSDQYATGGALVFGPDGQVISEDKESTFQDEMVIADLEGKRLADWRLRGNYSLKLRRPELYAPLVQPR